VGLCEEEKREGMVGYAIITNEAQESVAMVAIAIELTNGSSIYR
jgi:hypothetical protein